MAYGTPADPVSGTVITVAYAVANILDPIRWLRLMTGNTDPPGSSYVVVSTSTTITSWQKVPADALAAGVAVANLGYTPADIAGAAFTGNVSAPNLSAGTVSASGQVSAGQYAGGSLLAGLPSLLGLNLGNNGIASSGPVACTDVNPSHMYTGGTKTSGLPSVLGLNVGTNGIASDGPINPSSYLGGTTGAGIPSVLGLNVGTNGISSAATIFIAGSEVYWPSNPPPVSGGAGVPSGLIGAFETAAAIATGWARYTAADGRMLVGAGSVFSVTWTEATNYGAAWSHKHTSNSFSAAVTGTGTGSATGGPSDHTGNNSASGQSAGTGTSRADDPHNHSLNGVSLAVSVSLSASGTAVGDTSDASWVIPSRAVVWAKKT